MIFDIEAENFPIFYGHSYFATQARSSHNYAKLLKTSLIANALIFITLYNFYELTFL